jgi:ATP-dependent Lhr-like helicase
MQAEDLIAAVFPDQIACAENLSGERRIPDHPLVRQTIKDCLEEAMDLPGLESLLASLERGERSLLAKDVREASPLAQEVLTARPYAFLDDAPLEERRTQAVIGRRWADPQTASDLGTLDAAAIDRVREEAWPAADSADELADALEILGFVTETEGRGAGWQRFMEELVAQRRATVLRVGPEGPRLWVAASRLSQALAAFPSGTLEPPIPALPGGPGNPVDPAGGAPDAGAALAEIIRGRLEGLGPVSAAALAASCGLPEDLLDQALLRLESEGFVLRGRFTPAGAGAAGTEWCARGLLARIHRYTLNRLRAEIEPVTAADFMRFLFSWQRVAPDDRAEGARSLPPIVEMLEGFEAPAVAWERDILPARLSRYDPAWLDALCLSGRVVWARLSPPRTPPGTRPGAGPVRSTPIALLARGRLSAWRALTLRPEGGRARSTEAEAVLDLLAARGALFFDEIAGASGLLASRVENALAELVARGAVTSDGFTGLRALITPSGRRGSDADGRRGGRRRSAAPFGMQSAGRWTILWSGGSAADPADSPAEAIAPVLLRRYGVVFRRLLDREGAMPPWRDLLRAFRRMEGRGEVRGGRFVAGVSGEQFALPAAVERLRATRRAGPSGSLLAVGSADPLNLAGLLLPGPRIPPAGTGRILYRDGVPIAVREAGEIRHLVDLDETFAWRVRDLLVQRSVPPLLRASVGRSA